MYFPAQGMMMAAGQVVFGNPWYGVLLSVGLMCGALCWMLQGWLPPGWALLGGMLAVLRLGLFSNWVNGYYGGAIAATGGALVLGALPRFRRMKDGASVRDGVWLAVGAILLATSRPYEGLLVCAPAAVVLFFPAIQRPRSLIAPLALVLIAAGLMAHYDQRVFGSALTLPYQTNRMTYASAPVFLWESPRPAQEYRSKEMHDFFQIWEMHDFRLARTLHGFIDKTVQKFATAMLFFFGVALTDPAGHVAKIVSRYARTLSADGGRGVRARTGRERVVLSALCGPVHGRDLRTVVAVHAPLASLQMGARPVGLALVRFLPLVCLMLAGVRIYAEPLGSRSTAGLPCGTARAVGTCSCEGRGAARSDAGQTARDRPLLPGACSVRRLGLQQGRHRCIEGGVGAGTTRG